MINSTKSSSVPGLINGIDHVAAGAGNACVFFDPVGYLLWGTHQDQVAAAGDFGKTLLHIPSGQRLTTAIGVHDIGRQPFGVGRQCIAVGIATDIDARVARITDQLRFEDGSCFATRHICAALQFRFWR